MSLLSYKKEYWAENNPPNAEGGAIEFNCVTIQMRDARYPDDKNWVAQRCDMNLSGRDQYVCQKTIPQSTCNSGNKPNGEPRDSLNFIIPVILSYLFKN